MDETTPEMLIVAGPNGAGKTTLALKYANALDVEYIGADKIAHEINSKDPFSVRIQAGERFIRTIEGLIQSRRSFVVETTLAGKTFDRFIKDAERNGYSVTIVFVFLDSDELCVRRVERRVQKGGHFVPEADIRRRFKRSIANFWGIYRKLADNWVVAYNGGSHLQDVAIGSRVSVAIRDQSLLRLFFRLGGINENE
jgi:predicted ABC-type ATPase